MLKDINSTNTSYQQMKLEKGVWYGVTSKGHKLMISDQNMQKLVKLVKNMIKDKGVNMRSETILAKLVDPDKLEATNAYGLRVIKGENN